MLFAHGSGSSRHSPRNNYVAGVLREAGVGTLLMDLLTPEEDQRGRPALRHRPADATPAGGGALGARAAAAAHGLPLGFFGASTGAAAAIEAAALLGTNAAAVVSRGGRPDLASRTALTTVRAPTLLLVGGWDDGVIELNQQAYDQLACEKELSIVPGATHLFEEPGTLEQVAQQAALWFAGHFAPIPHA